MALTQSERDKFTAEQLAEIDRASNERIEKFLTLETPSVTVDPNAPQEIQDQQQAIIDQEKADYRAAVIDKWRLMTVAIIKARVNISGIKNNVIIFSEDNNYSTIEQEGLSSSCRHDQSRMILRAPDILAKINELQNCVTVLNLKDFIRNNIFLG